MLLNQGLSSWHILPGSMGSDILSPGKGLALYIQLSFKISGEQLSENEVFQGLR